VVVKKITKKVMRHPIAKGYVCGKIYLPKEWIGKNVKVELE